MIRKRAMQPARRLPTTRRLRPSLEAFEARLLLSGDVLTYHNDNARTGQYLTETTLTPANVNTGSFGKQFSVAVDGQIWAEPLFVSGVNIPGVGVRNVVYVATMHDSVYAFDADTPGLPLWHVSLTGTRADGTVVTSIPVADIGGSDIKVEVGILGTPVIDGTTGTIYFVARTKETLNGVSTHVQTLHDLDVTTGAERAAGPAIIAASVAGRGGGSDAQGNIAFEPGLQNQRVGLLLSGGVVYIAWASHSDNGPYHGWVMGYDAATMKQVAVWNATPDGIEGGIWASGAALSADENGNIFLSTGNGTFDAGSPGGRDYGDTLVELAPGGTTGLTVRDFFTPYNQQFLQDHDLDLDSGGIVLLPPMVKDGVTHEYALASSKSGYNYLLDRDPTHLTATPFSGLGGYDSSANPTDHVVQKAALSGPAFSAPAYFNGRVYLAGNYSPVEAFAVDGSGWSLAGVTKTPETYHFPSPSPVISANGSANGIVWAVQVDNFGSGGPAVLNAYNPADLSQEYYSSSQAPGGRDQAGPAIKFTVPTVAEGHVFVGGNRVLTVYGPIQSPGGAAAPAAPTGLTGSAASSAEVDLAWGDVTGDAQGFVVEQSNDGGSTYAIFQQLSPSVRTATVLGLQGRTPYSFRVRAYNAQGESAPAGPVAVVTPGPVGGLDFSAGFALAGGSIALNGSAKILGSALQLTEASAFEAGSAFDVTPVDVSQFHTRFRYLAVGDGSGATFTLQAAGPGALGDGGDALGYGGFYGPGITKSFAVALNISKASTGIFSGGQLPTSPLYSIGGGIDPALGHVIDVDLSYDGKTLTETFLDETELTTSSQTYAIDIPGAIGAGMAYAGFTGGTAAQRAVQQILGWTYLETRPPAVPTGLSAAPLSPQSIGLSWGDNSNNELGFDVEESTDGGATFHLVANVPADATSLTLANLTPATTYAFRVEAYNAQAISAPSNVAVASTPPLILPPRTPTQLYPTLITSTRIDLAWLDNANNEDGYKVLRKTGADGLYAVVATLPPSSTTYQDLGLSPSTAYEYHVQAYNAGGFSDFTGMATTTLDPGIDQHAGFAGLTGWSLNGSTKVAGAALRLTDGGAFEAGSAYDATPVDISRFAASFRIRSSPSQRNGLAFVIQAAGLTALGDGGSALGYGPFYGAIKVPLSIALKFGLNGTTGLYLGGALPTGGAPVGPGINFSQDVLDVSLAYDGATLRVTTTDEATGASAVQSYAVDIPGAVGQKTAWVGFSGGTGSNTATLDVLAFTYAPARAPTQPTGLSATATGPSTTDLSWLDHSEDESGFAIEASTDGGATYTRVATAPADVTTATLTGLSPSTTYIFRVRAFNAYGQSDPTVSAPVTTSASALAIDQQAGFAGLTGWSLNGSTKVAGAALRLTDGGAFEAGSAYDATPVDISRFAASFRIRSSPSQRNGLAFVIQAAGLTALGDGGSALGYGPFYGAIKVPLSIALKFGLNGTTGLYLGGALPTGGAPVGPGINFSQDVLDVSLAYDGATLRVTTTDEATGASAVQSYAVDIPGAVGQKTAWVGFSGGTGSNTATLDVLAFTYAPTRLPAAPSALSAAATPGQIALGWTDNADNETGFDVERSIDGGLTFVPLGVAGVNATTFPDTGVTAGVTYVYRVRARNGAGTSAYSNLATATAV